MRWKLTHGQFHGMYFNLAYRGDMLGFGPGCGRPVRRTWIIRRVIDTPDGPRLEVWGEKVAAGFIEGWYDERECSDVEQRCRGEWTEKPDAVGVTGDPRAEAVPSDMLRFLYR